MAQLCLDIRSHNLANFSLGCLGRTTEVFFFFKFDEEVENLTCIWGGVGWVGGVEKRKKM